MEQFFAETSQSLLSNVAVHHYVVQLRLINLCSTVRALHLHQAQQLAGLSRDQNDGEHDDKEND